MIGANATLQFTVSGAAVYFEPAQASTGIYFIMSLSKLMHQSLGQSSPVYCILTLF